MAGAKFVRADLHVHTYGDSDSSPEPNLDAYISAAEENEISVLGVTDHNSTRFARAAVERSASSSVFVVPGIEISTHDGHLLALFDPEDLDALEAFGNTGNLKLKTLSSTEMRSERSLLDLVQEIDDNGGLAIPAHVDVGNGMATKLRPAELTELLTSPALAGLEFATKEALETWFTDSDEDENRRNAWKARLKVPDLEVRGLGRLMSSDAHSPNVVGRDRASRTLTRLKLDEVNFVALRNAIKLNPKSRCKAEAVLPPSYPRVLDASFEGGFLDGVKIDFSENLNAIIGSRGSGKSTALLSIRACLGAKVPQHEGIDEPGRMPEKTTVRYLDRTGSERVAIRSRGQKPADEGGQPVDLRLADLGQEETGRLALSYDESPEPLLEFLDGFVVTHEFEEREDELVAQLGENATKLTANSGTQAQIKKLENDQARLKASLDAAKKGRVDEVARFAEILSAQAPLLAALEERISDATKVSESFEGLSVDSLAQEFDVDLSTKTASPYVEGETGIRAELLKFEAARKKILDRADSALEAAAEGTLSSLKTWQAEQTSLEERLKKKEAELDAQGLAVETGAIRDYTRGLARVTNSLKTLREKKGAFDDARQERDLLLAELHRNRENLFQARKAKLRRTAAQATEASRDVEIGVDYTAAGIDHPWRSWLTERFSFRMPRVGRIAKEISPRDMATHLRSKDGWGKLLELSDESGPYFTTESLTSLGLRDLLSLEVVRLPDRPSISIRVHGEHTSRPFNALSTGQQRSVLLGLLLCGGQSQPLILDQPEDHLDGKYIASSVVRQVEAAKETRQIIIATHSPNLVVLGDAEYVVPLVVADGRGVPEDCGSVDRPETREIICELLEGGESAYVRRGLKYGLRFS